MNSFFNALRSSPIKRAPGGWFGGIASGIALKFGWRVGFVRLGVLLSFLLPFIGIPLYIVLWILLPKTDGTIALEQLVGNRR
ncbi:phage shock protein PspC (stress-responsive transcriptional regulator) [Arthrobacter pigmenti]|uniref:Phage shock protein PspC (Stress-responsive transcriptional regulator) n=1 Tax=Arthrobacter pigmenti TaxID=271432 RepID=A0A846RQ28_9MICC|nr:PspC domain-containing protein [Arthrobacter pigmenti]NJC23189.1 phage shock protein PspC (stress-responsive transcriptional regulator) [Arthrobacter pigmenti]